MPSWNPCAVNRHSLPVVRLVARNQKAALAEAVDCNSAFRSGAA